MSTETLVRVERACAELRASNTLITFAAVAERAKISRTSLYRNQALRAVVDEHRSRNTDPATLTGLSREITHLRIAVEAIAGKVKDHEEQLRQIRGPGKRKSS
jgi:hypothetical protein